MLKYIILFSLSASIIFAQAESQIGSIAKFGAAGGISPIIIFPNYDGINSQSKKLGIENFDGPIVAWGGSGYAYVMIVDNLRLGGLGFSGSQSGSSSLNSVNNELTYSISGGAATIEYTFPFVKNMALSAGVIIGGGSLDILVYQNEGSFNWNSIWNDIQNNSLTNNEQISLSNSFFFFSPTVNLDYPITRFLALRGGVGYQFTVGSNWKISNDRSISGVPSSLNANGFFIQTGVFIGLFAF